MARETAPVATKPRKLRKDIQALRAIAVVFVILNHLWPGRFAGGYVGVDVFFVVSGFLISQHLLHELEATGRIKLGNFYARRARRLLPAAYLVALVSLLVAVFTVPIQRIKDITIETFAASAYFENWLLAAKSVDYSAYDSAATTVQHYWSLSMEEQFYLVWPVLMLLGGLWAAKRALRQRRVLLIVMSVLVLASFAYACFATLQFKPQAYFATPTRVWEFGIGALVAIIGTGLATRFPAWLRNVLRLGGLLLILWSGYSFSPDTAFPGPAALIPVLGTAAIIFAGEKEGERSVLLPLTIRPIQYVGDISYSLYLWHWPLIVMGPYILHERLSLTTRAIIVAATFVLAALTKHFVEDWGRRRLLMRTSNRNFFVALAASVAVVAAVTFPASLVAEAKMNAAAKAIHALEKSECFGAKAVENRESCGDPYGPAQVISVGDVEEPWYDDRKGCKVNEFVKNTSLDATCDFSGGKPAKTVWLVGDSHAEHWFKPIVALAEKHHWVLRIDEVGGCPTLPVRRSSIVLPHQGTYCYEWAQRRLQRIIAEKPDLVITSNYSSTQDLRGPANLTQEQIYAAAAEKFVAEVTAQGTKIAALRDIPNTLGESTPECVYSYRTEPLKCATSKKAALVPDPFWDGLKKTGSPAVYPIDLTDYFCDEERCYGLIGKTAVYFDDDHMSRSYALSMRDVLDLRLSEILAAG